MLTNDDEGASERYWSVVDAWFGAQREAAKTS